MGYIMTLVNLISLFILAFAHLVVDMYVGLLMPILPALEGRLNVSFAALAGVVGVCGIVVNLIQPLAAKVSSRFPKQLFLFIGPAISGAMALIGIVDSYEAFLIFALVSVIGTGIFHPDGMIAAHIASGDYEHVGVPIFLSGGFFGFACGAIVSSQWFMHFGFSGYWLLAAPGILSTVLIILIRQRVNYAALTESTVIRQKKTVKGVSFHIATIVTLTSCLVTPVAVIFTIYSKYLEILYGKDTAVEWSGFVIALLGLSGAAGSYLWGWISKRVSRYFLAGITQIMALVIYLIFIFIAPGPWLVIVTLCLGITWGSSIFPVIATAAKSARGLTPTERAGWVVGGSWGFAGLFQVFFGVSTSYGFDLVDSIKYPAIFIFCAVIISFWMWRQESKCNVA